VVEHLKYKALISNPSTTKRKKKEEKNACEITVLWLLSLDSSRYSPFGNL
jgi:hypothetical protein